MWFKLAATTGILFSELATCLSAPSSRLMEKRSSEVYDIALTSNRAINQDYPIVRLNFGAEKKFPLRLAVSIQSNETQLFRTSPGVCPEEDFCPVLEPGQGGLELSGGDYGFSSVEPVVSKGTSWRLDNFTIGISEEGTEDLGDYVDGILGLGPASTFIRQLAGTNDHKFSFYLGHDNGSFVIDGFYKRQAWGKYAKRRTDIGGSLPLQVRRLSLDIEDRTLLLNTNAIIDPASPNIIIPRYLMGDVVTNDGKIMFEQERQEQGRWPSLIFDIGDGVTIVVREETYVSSNQPAFRTGNGDQIILGRPFLHSAYLIVDHFRSTYYVAQANAILPETDKPSDMSEFSEEGQVEYKSIENSSLEPAAIEEVKDVSGSEGHKSSSNMNTGAIVGGTLGGVAFLAIFLGIFFWYRRRSPHLPRSYMGPPKRLSDLSSYSTQSEAMPPPYSPPSHTEEDFHFMGGFAYAMPQLEGSTTYVPQNTQNTAEPSSSLPFHGNRSLARSQTMATTVSEMDDSSNRDSQGWPRLPIYNTSASQGPAL